jgi:hypothetical protein
MIVAMLGMTMVAAQGVAAPATEAFIEARITGVDDARRVVSFEADPAIDLHPGDRFWIIDAERSVIPGLVFLTADGVGAGKLYPSDRTVDRVAIRSQSMRVLPQRSLQALRPKLPRGVTVRGQVTAVPPGHQTAWLDLGSDSGLTIGDSVIVERKGIPLARGEVVVCDSTTSLVSLERLVGNAVCDVGDRVELWPEPWQRKWGRLNSPVVDVRSSPEGRMVLLTGTAGDGLVGGKLVDLFRGWTYLGLARLIDVHGPFSRALLEGYAECGEPTSGDRAIARAAVSDQPVPLTAAVFRVERDYCLITAGEGDHVKKGERFVVRRPDPAYPGALYDVAELTVETVKIDHSGATIRHLVPDEPPVHDCDICERRMAGVPTWEPVGIVSRVNAPARTIWADVDSQVRIESGDVVRWLPLRQNGADERGSPEEWEPTFSGAVVVGRRPYEAGLYVPLGWGPIRHAPGARIEIAANE